MDEADKGTTNIAAFETVANTAASNLESYIEKLITAVGQYIIWPNLPQLDLTPHAQGDPDNVKYLFTDFLTTGLPTGTAMDPGFSTAVNTALADAVQTFNNDWAYDLATDLPKWCQANNETAAIYGLDVHPLFEEMLNGKYPGLNTQFIVKNSHGGAVEASTVSPTPANADAYLFWDGMHPTELAHTLLGDAAYDLIARTNDNFDSATVVSGASARVTGNNYGATTEPAEPTGCAGRAAGQTVWWQWTAPSGGSVQIDTFGSDFETALSVYTGSSVSTLRNGQVFSSYDFSDPTTGGAVPAE